MLRWFEPQRGEAHLAKIIEALCERLKKEDDHATRPTGGPSGYSGPGLCPGFVEAFKFLLNMKKRNAILFAVSDWIIGETEVFDRLLKSLACEYDMVAVRVTDRCEEVLPDVGMMRMVDPETGEELLVDTGSAEMRWVRERFLRQKQMLEKCGADLLDLKVGGNLSREMTSFFHKRIGRQAG